MAEAVAVSGRCLCGVVSFTALAPRPEVGACHCRMYQRWASGPLLAIGLTPSSLKLHGADSLGVYASSEWGERCFCRGCGSPLFWRSRDGAHLHACAGALDDKTALTLTEQIFVDEKPAYYEFANDTRRLTGAEFIALMTAPKDES